MSLDTAENRFKEAPSLITLAYYLGQALDYHADGRIGEQTLREVLETILKAIPNMKV